MSQDLRLQYIALITPMVVDTYNVTILGMFHLLCTVLEMDFGNNYN